MITSIGEILFDIYESEKKLGGAPFNFIYHVTRLIDGGNFISRIGNDTEGKEILDFFKQKNISRDYLQIDKSFPTGRAIANLDEMKIPHWIIEDKCAYDYLETNSEIEDLIGKSGCIYYGTLAQRNPVSGKTIQSLFNRNTKYFCDLNIRQKYFTKEILELSIKAADVLKINEEELILLNNIFFHEKYDLIASAIQLKSFYNLEILCVTCGENGSYPLKDDEIDYHKSLIKETVDTVGAGDAFAAVLCLGFLKEWDLKKLNKTANDFAGKIISIRGALPEEDSFYKETREIISGS